MKDGKRMLIIRRLYDTLAFFMALAKLHGGDARAILRAHRDYRKLKNAYLVSYDRAIPTLRQADHCISCGECLSHCPQSIPIPGELQRINRYVEKLKQDTL